VLRTKKTDMASIVNATASNENDAATNAIATTTEGEEEGGGGETTTTTTTTTTLYVPSTECETVDELFQLLMNLGGLTWSKTNYTEVIISAGIHEINNLAEDADGATFTGVYLKGPHYKGLTIKGESGIEGKTILTGGLILCTGDDISNITFEDLFICNGDQAGWRSWMGNGLYVDDGAHQIICKRCTFYDCEKLGIFVGDVQSHVRLHNCTVYGNKRGGIMASEGGTIDVMGDYTQVYENGKYGLFSYMAPSVVRVSFDLEEETRPSTIRLDNNKKGEYNASGGGKIERINNLLE
jgi:hypothetical protein